jgi:hypothetical protein
MSKIAQYSTILFGDWILSCDRRVQLNLNHLFVFFTANWSLKKNFKGVDRNCSPSRKSATGDNPISYSIYIKSWGMPWPTCGALEKNCYWLMWYRTTIVVWFLLILCMIVYETISTCSFDESQISICIWSNDTTKNMIFCNNFFC